MSLAINQRYDLHLKGQNVVLPYSYSGALLRAILPYEDANKLEIIAARFNSIYPNFDAATKTAIGNADYRTYTYYRLILTNGDSVIIPEEWIDIASATLVTLRPRTITLPTCTTEQEAAIKTVLSRLNVQYTFT